MKMSNFPRPLHAFAVALSLISLAGASFAHAEEAVPVLRSKARQITIADGYKFRRNSWFLSADADPDIYVSFVPPGTIKTVKFISTDGELVFKVEGGKSYPFDIIYEGRTYHTKIEGKAGPDTYDLKL